MVFSIGISRGKHALQISHLSEPLERSRYLRHDHARQAPVSDFRLAIALTIVAATTLLSVPAPEVYLT